MLPAGKRANNAWSISLPSLWQHYLVAMATSLDKLENKVQIYHLHFHTVKRLRKSVHYIRRSYLTKYASFLAVTYMYLTYSNELNYLWSYLAEVHQFLNDIATSSPLLARTIRR